MGNKSSWKRSRKYDEYDDVSSRFHCQWISDLFYFVFLCMLYSFQKEKLHLQVRKVIFAFIPKQKADAILNICSLTYRTFANFLTGQCLEAVILGMMFVITLSILKMPYALLIGILIAFTALVPIFGAFIGCAVGSFLIFMVNLKYLIIFSYLLKCPQSLILSALRAFLFFG